MGVIAEENAYLLSSYQIRAHNLREYAKRIGQDKDLAKILGITPARLHCLLRNESMPFTEKMARAIEQRLGYPMGSLDIPSDRYDQHKVPVYLLEDLRDLEHATPSNYINYSFEEKNIYFIQILNKVYEPHISIGAKILINPNRKEPSNGKLFAISYKIDNFLSKTVIRLYKNNVFIDFLSNEAEEIHDYTIYGCCETIISTPTFG